MWGAVALVIAPVLQRIVRDLERQSRRARVSNERVEKLFDDAPHGVALLDASGSIIRVNISMAVLVGLDPPDMVGHRLAAFETPGETRIEDHLGRLLQYRGEPLQSECHLRDSGGNDVSVSLSSTVVGDAQMGEIVMVNVVDISDRRRYLDRLAHLADHDVLTGLANRRRFESELDRHLDRCRRHGPTGALLLLDLDNFKQVNDTLGHNAGDQLLITIAGLLRRSIRSTDVVARLGGDEFAILLTDCDQPDAARVAGLVVDRIATHAATLDGVARRVTASVGAVTFRAAAEHAADVLALADMTMYDAKDAGRNQVVVLSEGDERGPRTAARLHWQSRIEAALAEDRFELHLQPIMRHPQRPDQLGRGAAAAARRGRAGPAVPVRLHRRAGRTDAAGRRLGRRQEPRAAGPDAPRPRSVVRVRGQPVGPLHRQPRHREGHRRLAHDPRRRPVERSSSRSPRPRRSPTSRWREPSPRG